MSRDTIQIVARLTTLPERAEELKLLLIPQIEPTRKEEGCIQYTVLENIEKLTDFTLVEEWESQDMFEKHVSSERIQAVAERITALLAKPADVNFYRSL